MRKLAIITAAMLVLFIFPTTIYALQNNKMTTNTLKQFEGTPEAIAVHFLKNSPTFKFDGIETSIEVLDSKSLERYPVLYVMEIGFTSSSAGYGDRSSGIVAQVLTDHKIVVQVENGAVVSAIIDGVWDELIQGGVPTNDVSSDGIATPESARDAILSYIISRYGLDIEAPNAWTVVDTTPEGLCGYQTLLYTSGDWMVVVKHGTTLTPIYSISVQYSGDNSFTWMGTLEMKISNEEYEPMNNKPDTPVYYSTEDARDMALKFLQTNHLDAGVKLPSEWVESNLVPVGVVGASKIQYVGGGWTVTVSAPVVWKPTYVVEIEYIGVDGFRWSGTLPTGGEIVETTFHK
jgi:hypothetical protein